MPSRSRLAFCTACTILVLLACMVAGCTSYPSAPVTATPPAVTGGGNTIAIKNFAFEPGSLTVKTGTTVSWTNQDSVSHIIASDTGSPVPFSSDSLPNGASYSFTFTQAGTYSYHCTIHPSMKGTVIVQ
ncbi:cupredoxin family copper-binding protein [Methanoregula sp.]|uniref:cupredoxin domain-containing protein n=1 Tax=Methanoregula sp. TaxID=2052170 RepID=UPI00236C3D63|nr:cupredoxin family copper-binding protein [Methanoregula sp.]MDD1685960.1 cupredoxin family copper-binding protein [Methanoregula sp.]